MNGVTPRGKAFPGGADASSEILAAAVGPPLVVAKRTRMNVTIGGSYAVAAPSANQACPRGASTMRFGLDCGAFMTPPLRTAIDCLPFFVTALVMVG